MQIRELKENEVSIVAIEGRLDSATATDFESKLLGLINQGERRMCIDCSGLTYLNSTALRGFLVVAKQMGSVGGKLVISDLCPSTRKVFEVIGFTKIITLLPTREEALQYLSGQPVAT